MVLKLAKNVVQAWQRINIGGIMVLMTPGITGLPVFQIHTKQLQVLERGRYNPGLFDSTTAVRRWQGLPSEASSR